MSDNKFISKDEMNSNNNLYKLLADNSVGRDNGVIYNDVDDIIYYVREESEGYKVVSFTKLGKATSFGDIEFEQINKDNPEAQELINYIHTNFENIFQNNLYNNKPEIRIVDYAFKHKNKILNIKLYDTRNDINVWIELEGFAYDKSDILSHII
jgi:hypothetical protein